MKRALGVLALVVALAACTPVSQPTTPTAGSDIRSAGDSNTTGHGVEPYPSLLSTALGVPIDDIGVAGMAMTFESNYGLTYYTSIPDTINADIVKHGAPKTLTIMGGTNDFHWWQTRPGDDLAGLESVVTSLDANLTAQGIRVIWVTPPPFNVAESGFPATAVADRVTYNAWLIAQFPGRVADCGTQLEQGTGSLPPGLEAGDGIHLNEDGQQIVADCLEGFLER